MAGVYIHVPFCKQKCSYCDFHFSTDSSYVKRMVAAMVQELKSREWLHRDIETIYFGGGTPSFLSEDLLRSILDSVHQEFNVMPGAEISIEANPDDMNQQSLKSWLSSGINRLSVGIQSFDSRDLVSMNRAHDDQMGKWAVRLAQDAGFNDISVDMMYGLPERSLTDFETNVQQFIALDVDHISAYNLTIEKGTVYGHKAARNELKMPSEEEMEKQFALLRTMLSEAAYEQYEVSNFARRDKVSRHNSAYWKRVPYMGIGPSAHSYDGEWRMWNIAHNHKYMKAISEGEHLMDREKLSLKDRFNEHILTGLRTKWGVDIEQMKREFNVDLVDQTGLLTQTYAGCYDIVDGCIILNPEGLLIADRISSDLFLLD